MERIEKKSRTICFYDTESTGISRDADLISIGLIAVTEKYTPYKNLTFKTFEEAFNTAKNSEERFINNENKGEGVYKQIESFYQPKVKTFYAEFTDFNIDKCDDWVKENVVGKLYLKEPNYNKLDKKITKKPFEDVLNNNHFEIKGSQESISFMLKQWLSQFETICFYADLDVIDKPMLIDLIADWDYSNPCGFISKSARHYEESKSAYVCDKCNQAKDKDCQYKIGLPKHLPNINYYDFYDIHSILKWKGIDPDINREEFTKVREEVIPLPFSNCDNTHNALWDAYVCWKMYEKLKSM